MPRKRINIFNELKEALEEVQGYRRVRHPRGPRRLGPRHAVLDCAQPGRRREGSLRRQEK
jgi:hypothetical protein